MPPAKGGARASSFLSELAGFSEEVLVMEDLRKCQTQAGCEHALLYSTAVGYGTHGMAHSHTVLCVCECHWMPALRSFWSCYMMAGCGATCKWRSYKPQASFLISRDSANSLW